jgi:hypothetical protein
VFGAPLMRIWCIVDARLVRLQISYLTVMDDKFKAILDSIPKKHQRSKLEPYTELIDNSGSTATPTGKLRVFWRNNVT